MKIKKKLKKFGKGGQNPPIITKDKNDPRIQAYQDSLDLYNTDKVLAGRLKNDGYANFTDNQASGDTKSIISRHFGKPSGNKMGMKKVSDNMYKVKDYYADVIEDKYGSQYLSPNVQPQGLRTWGKFVKHEGDLLPSFDYRKSFNYENAKPVQPIIYQPEENNTPPNPTNYGMVWQRQSDGRMTLGFAEEKPKQRPKEQPINIQSAKPDLLNSQFANQEFNPIGFKKGSYFSRPLDNSERAISKEDVGKKDYFDKTTGRKLGTFGNGGKFIDQRQDSYYTPSSSDRQSEWEIVDDLPKFKNAGLIKNAPVNPASFQTYQQANPAKGAPTNPIILPEVNITATRAQYPTELGKRLQYSRDESQKLKDAAAEERWTNSYKGEQGLGNDIIGEQIGFGALAKSLFSIKPIASELTGIGKNAIQNTYKLNPYANKLGMYNRVVGEDAILDMQKTGLIRTGENAGVSSGSGFRQTPYPSFGKGNPGQTYINQVIEQGKTPHIISTNRPMGVSTLGRHGKGSTMFPIGEDYIHGSKNYLGEFPATEARVFEGKPHWLKGYKEVSQPASNFKSEIDWSKWNSEIPSNQSLIKEYNAIEQTSKANGSWMKNPDGSAFQGTPEQFIQQNSQNFKKAFGNSKLINPDGSPTIQYHGSAKKFDTFDESKFQLGDSGYSGKGIYTTPDKNKASSYALSSKSIHTGEYEPTVYELYGQGNNPISAEDLIKQNKDYDLFNFHRAKNWQGDVPLEQQMLDYDVAIRNQTRGIERVSPWNQAAELVFPTNKQLKSAIGNNGMFDITNPNIYKGLIPPALGIGIASQQEKKFGGNVNTDWEIVQDDNEWELV